MIVGSGVPDPLKRLIRPLRSRAGEVPALVPLLVRAATPGNEHLRVGAGTTLVIEGFPRSGNSFAAGAFGLATGYAPGLVSNTHLPAQVRLAVDGNVPTLVVIRPAVDAVPSLCVAAGYLRAGQALREWLAFYRYVEPLRDRFVLATFAEVTSDFGAVLDRVNTRFGTSFPGFEHTEENADRVFAALEEYGERKRGHVREQSIARPSDARREATAAARAELQQPRHARRLAAAERLYATLVESRRG